MNKNKITRFLSMRSTKFWNFDYTRSFGQWNEYTVVYYPPLALGINQTRIYKMKRNPTQR